MGCTYLICDLGLCGLAIGLDGDHLEAVFGGVARRLIELLNYIGIFSISVIGICMQRDFGVPRCSEQQSTKTRII